VVGLAVFGWRVAFGATAIAFDQRDPLWTREHALAAAQVEDFAVAAEYGGNDARIPGEAA